MLLHCNRKTRMTVIAIPKKIPLSIEVTKSGEVGDVGDKRLCAVAT